MAIFGTGINWGILIGFLLGGWINEWFGWRVAFLWWASGHPARTGVPIDGQGASKRLL